MAIRDKIGVALSTVRAAFARLFGRTANAPAPYAVSRPSTFYEDIRIGSDSFGSDDARTVQPHASMQPLRMPQIRAAGQTLCWLPGTHDRTIRTIMLTLLDANGDRTFKVDATSGADIGTKVSGGLNLRMAGIRPKHCQIFHYQGLWFIADWGVGQTLNNGTRVIGAARIEQGDLLTIGTASVVFDGEISLRERA